MHQPRSNKRNYYDFHSSGAPSGRVVRTPVQVGPFETNVAVLAYNLVWLPPKKIILNTRQPSPNNFYEESYEMVGESIEEEYFFMQNHGEDLGGYHLEAEEPFYGSGDVVEELYRSASSEPIEVEVAIVDEYRPLNIFQNQLNASQQEINNSYRNNSWIKEDGISSGLPFGENGSMGTEHPFHVNSIMAFIRKAAPFQGPFKIEHKVEGLANFKPSENFAFEGTAAFYAMLPKRVKGNESIDFYRNLPMDMATTSSKPLQSPSWLLIR